ncbi:MAG TPA: ABC transporter permease subunit [Polyangiaceae bacterium]|nr:ABC transporter permease subunit [Polyangiaceae bacterium]
MAVRAAHSGGVMLRALFRVEWKSALRDGSLRALLVVFSLLVLYAAVGGARFTKVESAAAEAAQREESAKLESLRAELQAIAAGAPVKNAADPRSPMQVGRELLPRVAALPAGPLAVVAVGQRDVLPQTVLLTTKPRVLESETSSADGPLRQSNGPFDLSFVFVFLLPLIVIALSYDLLSSERERGTLSLVLSQPVALTRFVLSKALQRAALLLAIVLAFALVAPLLARASFTAPGAPLRLALYAGLVTLYTLFWLSLALFVNTWGRSSAANALSLVGLWLALLVVVPGLASVTVDTVYPSPSRVELINLARAAAKDAESESSAMEGNHGKPVAADSERRALAVQAAFESQVAPVLRGFSEQHARQQSMVNKLRFLSPAIVLSEGLAEVADASVARHRDFSVQVDAYHAELKAFFGQRAQRGAALTLADSDALPQFRYVAPHDDDLASRVLSGLLALAAACAALVALAVARLRRASVAA